MAQMDWRTWALSFDWFCSLEEDPFMKVGVVGAGISGLQTALHLEKAGCEVTIFEAKHRLGGRLLTADEGQGVLYEAGGEWIDADQPRLHELAKKYSGGLDAAVREPALAIFRGETRRTDDLWDDLVQDETAVEHAARALARELSLPAWTNKKFKQYDQLNLEDFIRQNCSSDRGYWWMQANLRSDEGEDLDQIGLLGWLCGYVHYINRENLNRGESEMSAFRVPGGFSNLLEKMRQDIKGDIVFGSELTKVSQNTDGSVLHFGDSAERFDRVVLTLPPRCLERVIFEPALDFGKRCAFEACGMSRVIKIAWEFKSAWWKERGFCGRMHHDGPLQQLWEGTRGEQPVLTAYICGSRAKEWVGLGDPVNASIYELSQIFPEAAEQFKRGFVHDWINDPYAQGGFSNYQPGYALEHAENMVRPVDRIHFAGEHTATWVGFIEGALESAERVSAEVLA
jgi:monoamine oxidase